MVNFGRELSFGKKKKEPVEAPQESTVNKEKGNPFKRDISFGRKKDAYPTKRSINLATAGQTLTSRYNNIFLGVLLAILLVIFVKFAVVDPLLASAQNSNQISSAQAELNQLKASNAGKSATSEEYAHYVVPNLTADETSLTPRDDIVALLKDKVVGIGSISSLKVTGNTVTVTCVNVGLQDLSSLVKSLESDKRVSYVTVSTAQASEGKASSATVVISMKDATAIAALSAKGSSNGS